MVCWCNNIDWISNNWSLICEELVLDLFNIYSLSFNYSFILYIILFSIVGSSNGNMLSLLETNTSFKYNSRYFVDNLFHTNSILFILSLLSVLSTYYFFLFYYFTPISNFNYFNYLGLYSNIYIYLFTLIFVLVEYLTIHYVDIQESDKLFDNLPSWGILITYFNKLSKSINLLTFELIIDNLFFNYINKLSILLNRYTFLNYDFLFFMLFTVLFFIYVFTFNRFEFSRLRSCHYSFKVV